MSAVPAALRAVSNALTAGVPAGTLVITGPGATNDPGNVVLVGVSDPDETSLATAVTGQQSWAQLGGKFRDEKFSVHCVAVAWNGDGDCLAAVDSAFAILAAIETALVADPTLSGALLYSVGLTAFNVRLVTDNNGAAAHLPFDVECRTRI